MDGSTSPASVDPQREYRQLKQLFNLLNDGIIVMNRHRITTFVNPSATQMTGWALGDTIPYCTYCQSRDVCPGEERCLLASQPVKGYFESELPTKNGSFIGVGMSRTFLSGNADAGERDMVITIRDVRAEWREKELELGRKLNQHTLEVQEQERKRLSQELHDGISQTLYGVSLKLEHLLTKWPSKSHEIRELHREVRRCGEEVRNMSHTLYPAVLYDLGLIPAVRLLVEQLATPRRSIDLSVDLAWEPEHQNPHAVHVYRIVQEALHNAIHHGDATRIEVALTCHDDQCAVCVRDNGHGFDPAQRRDFAGYGLRSMEERARALRGRMLVDSSASGGTAIDVRFPHPSQALQEELVHG